MKKLLLQLTLLVSITEGTLAQSAGSLDKAFTTLEILIDDIRKLDEKLKVVH